MLSSVYTYQLQQRFSSSIHCAPCTLASSYSSIAHALATLIKCILCATAFFRDYVTDTLPPSGQSRRLPNAAASDNAFVLLYPTYFTRLGGQLFFSPFFRSTRTAHHTSHLSSGFNTRAFPLHQFRLPSFATFILGPCNILLLHHHAASCRRSSSGNSYNNRYRLIIFTYHCRHRLSFMGNRHTQSLTINPHVVTF